MKWDGSEHKQLSGGRINVSATNSVAGHLPLIWGGHVGQPKEEPQKPAGQFAMPSQGNTKTCWRILSMCQTRNILLAELSIEPAVGGSQSRSNRNHTCQYTAVSWQLWQALQPADGVLTLFTQKMGSKWSLLLKTTLLVRQGCDLILAEIRCNCKRGVDLGLAILFAAG